MSEEQPILSIIIPVYNQIDLLARCLASLSAQSQSGLEVIVVDDASPTDPRPIVSQYQSVRLLCTAKNSGYAAANNVGLNAARGRFLLFLNSDTELPPDACASYVQELVARPEAAAIAPLHRAVDGQIQRTCFGFPRLQTGAFWDSALHRWFPQHRIAREYTLSDWDHASERWVEHAQTSCLVVRREVYEAVGEMDPTLFLFYNDADYCYRMARLGYRIWFQPRLDLLHHGNASVKTFGQADAQLLSDRFRYYRKWFGWRGAMAVRCSLWSRVLHDVLWELGCGDIPCARRKLEKGLRLGRAVAEVK